MEERGAPEMLSAVWKVTHRIADVVVLELPEGSTLLDVGDQRDGGQSLDFWFLVPDVQAATKIPPPVEARTVRILGTGHVFSLREYCAEDYWKTVVSLGGALVWHVFLEGER